MIICMRDPTAFFPRVKCPQFYYGGAVLGIYGLSVKSVLRVEKAIRLEAFFVDATRKFGPRVRSLEKCACPYLDI